MKKSYLIGNAHIDAMWLWEWQEGLAEVRSTFRSALDRLNEFDGWIFTSAAAQYYRWIEETDAEMFAEIAARVREGRWCIVGGWWIQPDCNLPSGESFCRQGLYGQRYFSEKFGVRARTGYNVDSFGHSAGLPQILKKSGLENYVFSRPGAHERDLPELFEWRSPDGSGVRAARIPIGYESNSLPELKEKVKKFLALREGERFPQMLFYGVGNHGGGPTIEMLDYLKGISASNGFEFSSPDLFFEATKALPTETVTGDLGKHAVGCYSAHSTIKKNHRKAENALIRSEKFAVAAQELCGRPYPAAELERTWKNFLFHQFHDALCGCSIERVCEDAAAAFAGAYAEAERLSAYSVQAIAAQVDTSRGFTGAEANARLGKPVVVFNAEAWSRSAEIRVAGLYKGQELPRKTYSAFDVNGNRFPVQLVRGQSLFWYTRDGVFRAEIPAYGYKLFYIREDNASACAKNCDLKIREKSPVFHENTFNIESGGLVMENSRVALSIDASGAASLYDKRLNREFLSGGIYFTAEDCGDEDTWGHAADSEAWKESNRLGVWGFCRSSLGRFAGRFECVETKILEAGEVECRVRCRYRYGVSEIVCDYILHTESEDVGVQVKIDWREKQKLARMHVPFSSAFVRAEFETAYAHISRAAVGEEDCAHKWADFSEKTAGLALLNDGAYSYRASAGEAAVLLARSSIYADHAGVREKRYDYEYLDMGEQTFSFVLHPHGAPDYAEITRLAAELNNPCAAVWEGYHAGKRAGEGSFIEISAPSVVVRAVKRAEDGKGIVVRAYETEGKRTECRLRLFETETTAVFAPFEIKTLRFFGKKAVEQDILEEPLLDKKLGAAYNKSQPSPKRRKLQP